MAAASRILICIQNVPGSLAMLNAAQHNSCAAYFFHKNISNATRLICRSPQLYHKLSWMKALTRTIFHIANRKR